MNYDFKELLAVLNAHEVRYLVVGGYAVIHYAEPRYTKDLNLWIEPERGNALRFRSAMIAFGGWLNEMSVEDFSTPKVMFQLGLPPTRIDFLTSLPGLEFCSCWDRREAVPLGNQLAYFIGKEDLIHAKLTANRPQDQIHVANLRSAAAKPNASNS